MRGRFSDRGRMFSHVSPEQRVPQGHLYRWPFGEAQDKFVGLDADASVWVPTTFTKNRERLQQGDIFQRFISCCRATGRTPAASMPRR